MFQRLPDSVLEKADMNEAEAALDAVNWEVCLEACSKAFCASSVSLGNR